MCVFTQNYPDWSRYQCLAWRPLVQTGGINPPGGYNRERRLLAGGFGELDLPISLEVQGGEVASGAEPLY